MDVAQSERARSRALLQPINVGRLTHAVAAAQLERGEAFDVASLRQCVDALISPRISVNHKQAIRQRVTTALVVYREALVPAGWRFVSAEEVVRDVKLDILWEQPSGALVADELKTGTWPLSSIEAATRQCESQCAAGREAFGDSFEAVRLIVPEARKVGEMRSAQMGEFQWH